MTTNLLSVIEQQHKALEMLQGKLTGNVNGADESCFIISMKNQVSYAQMVRVSEAIAAGKQALEKTQGEAASNQTKTLVEHNGCGNGAQVEQFTVILNRGDKVVLVMGAYTSALQKGCEA